MPINVQLPSLLSDLLGQREISLEASTLDEAFAAIRTEQPELSLHLFEENGALREHVLCFLNGTNTRWFDEGPISVCPDDTLLFMQAVSGG